MSNLKERLKQLASAQLEKAICREMDKWPPDCMGALYQPKRPPLPGQPRPQQPTAPPVPTRSATDLPTQAGPQSPVSGT